MNINPKVIDLYHGNSVTSFDEAYKAGIRGVIHKATEGATLTDKLYVARREMALDAGMLWGAYHFLRPGNMADQARRFVDEAKPTEATLLAVDHEDPRVTGSALEAFLDAAWETVGKHLVIYSGFLIKEQVAQLPEGFLGPHRLWLAQYSSTPKWPRAWDKPFLWQFTGDGEGPEPNSIPGIEKNCDISSFDGTDEALTEQWSS